MLNKIHQTVKPFLQNTVNTIFPPQCLLCRSFVEDNGNLCVKCWEDIKFISSPYCNKCGNPFEIEASDEALCGNCIATPPRFNKARAVFVYEDVSRKLITRFKYGDKTHASDHFAGWMSRVGQEMLKNADIITPVPLHKTRLFIRRYNQSALLAKSISRRAGVPIIVDLLVRVKNTKPQAGLSYNQRIKNVSTAFKTNPLHEDYIKGKNIVLVDDVITTGSTIDACTKALLKAGAENVDVITLGMTVV